MENYKLTTSYEDDNIKVVELKQQIITKDDIITCAAHSTDMSLYCVPTHGSCVLSVPKFQWSIML